MVLSSAAASTQTTILPTARTTLSMAAYKALPDSFAKIHPKYLTPTVSTHRDGRRLDRPVRPDELHLGGNVISDAVTAIGIYIAFYYGLTALACVWYYRKTLTSSARNLWMRGIIPLPGLGDHVGGGHLQPAERLDGDYRLHLLDGAWPALGDRRDLPHRFLRRGGRGGRVRLHADHRPAYFKKRDADQGHAHAGAGRTGPGPAAAGAAS